MAKAEAVCSIATKGCPEVAVAKPLGAMACLPGWLKGSIVCPRCAPPRSISDLLPRWPGLGSAKCSRSFKHLRPATLRLCVRHFINGSFLAPGYLRAEARGAQTHGLNHADVPGLKLLYHIMMLSCSWPLSPLQLSHILCLGYHQICLVVSTPLKMRVNQPTIPSTREKTKCETNHQPVSNHYTP